MAAAVAVAAAAAMKTGGGDGHSGCRGGRRAAEPPSGWLEQKSDVLNVSTVFGHFGQILTFWAVSERFCTA